MPSFRHRSYQKELLDRNDLPFEDIKRNMQELHFINAHLGGHRITLHGLQHLIRIHPKDPLIHIVEIGSGGGDNLRVIREWAEKNKHPVKLTGVDINPECIDYARTIPGNKGIDFIVSDYREVRFEKRPDIIFSSLFTHHFTDEEVVDMLRWLQDNTATGFFINDLHRHPAAYYSIRFLTKVFSKSYLVKHDAPLSVLRGFKRREWKALFSKAGICNFRCRWKWAFRWLIIAPKDTHGTQYPSL